MAEERKEDPYGIIPANNNTNPDGDADIAPWQKLDKVVLSIAGLIGRQLAGEHFEALQGANDNKTPTPEAEGRKQDIAPEQD
ncbi:hypothetical protein SAMN05518861_12022 [Mesorhizobium sp. YR577]|nr:hypothetical protein SAMN05518861_12022 [Mesorhizobium sp. YR577]